MEKHLKSLKKLISLKNAQSPILSIYLGSANRQAPKAEYFLTMLHSLIHQQLSKEELKNFRKIIERIENYLREEYDPRGKRSIAFFCNDKLWKTVSFEFYLPPMIVVSYAPYLVPILEAKDDYKKYAVLLVDREKARVFTVHMGEIEEHKDFLNGLVPQQVKAIKENWGRYDKISRHIDDHLNRHLKLVIQAASDFAREEKPDFIVLGGHKELFKRIRRSLPWPFNHMVRGEFISELNIPINKVFLESKKIASQIRKGGD